jgi:uncharacterized membrane protein YphA (DoxX/SURF4 family)
VEFTWLSRWQPQLLAILRIVVGLLFLEHALSKFFAFPVPFPVHPLPPLLVAAGVIELVAGVLVTIGLFTRLAAFIASGEMAVGYWMECADRLRFRRRRDREIVPADCSAGRNACEPQWRRSHSPN